MTGPSETCEKILLIQAEFDGELDAAEAAALQTHRAACPVCRAAAAQLAEARELCRDGLYEPMPEAMQRRLFNNLDMPTRTPARPQRRFLWSWRQSGVGFAVGAACAAALAFFVISPGDQALTEQIVAAHVRALQPGHLEDVASSDRHTVKPWFDGRIDFAPPVKELGAEGFPLTGGRLDYLAGRPVAALIYRRDKHIIDLFVWPASGGPVAPIEATQQGYNVVRWSDAGMNFWAASDVERRQLREFARAWQRTP
jgi:anti-sigma factor RsiW